MNAYIALILVTAFAISFCKEAVPKVLRLRCKTERIIRIGRCGDGVICSYITTGNKHGRKMAPNYHEEVCVD